MSSAHLNLANLPSDIIRKIAICIGKEMLDVIDQIRMISPSWNAICFENLIKHKCYLPPLKYFALWNYSDYWTVIFMVDPKFQKYFGVSGSSFHRMFDKTKVQETWLMQRLATLLSRCSYIETFVFDCRSTEALQLIVQRCCIEELVICTSTMFNPKNMNLVKDFVRYQKVRELNLECIDLEKNVNESDLFIFLTETTRLVSTININSASRFEYVLNYWEAKTKEWSRTAKFRARVDHDDKYYAYFRGIIVKAPVPAFDY